jgi:hypothetical protein
MSEVPQTHTEALTLALWLAVTAPDEERSALALAFAESLSEGLSLEQVTEAQDATLELLEVTA